MRIIDPRSAYLARYLKSRTAHGLADWDRQEMSARASTIDVYCVLGWSDVTRALSAAQHVEREVRRAGRVYRDLYGPVFSDDNRVAPPDRFIEHLADSPSPLHTNQAGMVLVDVAGPPMALHVQPTNDVEAALAHAAASILGFVMAGFGKPFAVDWLTGRNVRDGDLALSSVSEYVASGRPAFEVVGQRELRADDLEGAPYQTVSSPSAYQYGYFDVHLVVQRVYANTVDLVHARF